MVEQGSESKRPELVYGQLPAESEGWGEIRKIADVTGNMQVNERDADGKVVGRRTVASVRVVLTPEGIVVGIPGGEAAPIPWQDLRGVLPEETLKQITNALIREKRRRKNKKTRRTRG
jgi:hypothetical protein